MGILDVRSDATVISLVVIIVRSVKSIVQKQLHGGTYVKTNFQAHGLAEEQVDRLRTGGWWRVLCNAVF